MGCGGDLIFPGKLNRQQRDALHRRLVILESKNAQQVLDELAGRMAITPVRNPIRYYAALIDAVQRRKFLPELGLAVASARETDLGRQTERARLEQIHSRASNLLSFT